MKATQWVNINYPVFISYHRESRFVKGRSTDMLHLCCRTTVFEGQKNFFLQGLAHCPVTIFLPSKLIWCSRPGIWFLLLLCKCFAVTSRTYPTPPILMKQNFLTVSVMVIALFEVLCKRFCVNDKMLILVLCEGENAWRLSWILSIVAVKMVRCFSYKNALLYSLPGF